MTAKIRLMVTIILLVISLSLISTTPSYARPEFGDDCVSCHTEGGIVVASNVTDTLEVRTSSSFAVEVGAEGDTEELTIIWPEVADNPSFAFIPSKITDNGLNDINSEENKVKGIFKITAPATQGEYTIQVFMAGSGKKGGTLIFQVIVTAEAPSEEPHIENILPTAYFLYFRHGMKMEFKDRSWDVDGSIVSWQWDFDDGSFSTEKNPTHTFPKAGTYKVVLTVTDDQGGSNNISKTFKLPSRDELLQLWTLQVSIGSVMIVFTTLFTIGIAISRRKEVE